MNCLHLAPVKGGWMCHHLYPHAISLAACIACPHRCERMGKRRLSRHPCAVHCKPLQWDAEALLRVAAEVVAVPR